MRISDWSSDVALPISRLVLPDLERPGATASPSPSPSGTPTPSPTETPDQASVLARYTLPAFARHSLARVGSARAGDGVRADAFGNADGRFLEALMRRLDTPLPSRRPHRSEERPVGKGCVSTCKSRRSPYH